MVGPKVAEGNNNNKRYVCKVVIEKSKAEKQMSRTYTKCKRKRNAHTKDTSTGSSR